LESWAINKTVQWSYKHNYQYDSNQDKRFDKTKDEVAFLICFLFDHLVPLYYIFKDNYTSEIRFARIVHYCKM
jgi:hypothetical protein